MSKEEAINLLKQVNHILVNSNSWLENTHEPLNIAFSMAIKALEQEPCDDCVSRLAVLEIQAKYAEHIGATKFWQMRDDIKELSPVTPQPKTEHWIPCSERLPEPYENVLRTVKSFGWNCEKNVHIDIGTICPIDTNVLAWMPLPEPYEEKRGNSDDSN